MHHFPKEREGFFKHLLEDKFLFSFNRISNKHQWRFLSYFVLFYQFLLPSSRVASWSLCIHSVHIGEMKDSIHTTPT